MKDWDKLYNQAETLLSRLEELLPVEQPEPDWKAAVAFRWRKNGSRGFIRPVTHAHHITFDALRGVERQKNLIDQNTHQFVQRPSRQ